MDRKDILAIGFLILVSSWVLTQTGVGLENPEIYGEEYLHPYGADTYYYLRLAREMTSGSTGDLRIAAPNVNAGWYPYIISAFSLFSSIEAAAYYLPVIFGLLSVVLVYFLGKRWSRETGMYASLVMAFHPLFVTWNHAGFADTNAINLFLSLLIVYCVSRTEENWGWGLSGLISLVVFWNIWSGAFYILFIIALMVGAVLLTQQSTKYIWLVGGLLAGLAVLFGRHIVDRLLPSTITAQQIQELMPVSWPELVSGLGGWIMVIVTLLCLAGFVYTSQKKDHAAVLAWLIPIFIAGLLSRRFLFYAAPPLALIIGFGFDEARKYFKNDLGKVIMLMMIPILLWSSVTHIQNVTPPVHDGVIDTLEHIKYVSTPDAVVVSWWSNGYITQYLSERRTFADPGSHDNWRVYKLAEFFLTENETDARNLIREMACAHPTCKSPESYVYAPASLLGAAKGMGLISGKPIKLSDIKRCEGRKCGTIDFSKGVPLVEGVQAGTLYDYRGAGRNVTQYGSGYSVVLFDNAKGTYAFMTDRPESMLVRLLAQDKFEHFKPDYRAEFPEQIVTYKVKWD